MKPLCQGREADRVKETSDSGCMNISVCPETPVILIRHSGLDPESSNLM
jgi:hypothetical protein